MTDTSSSDQQAPPDPLPTSSQPSLQALRADVLRAARELAPPSDAADGHAPGEGSRAGVTLERPPRAEFGDYSTNAALLLAPRLGAPPREVAQRLGAELQTALGASLERFEVAGPGFLNLFVSDAWLCEALDGVLASGERLVGPAPGAAQRVLVEFVSANPTGPLHVGHARNAAYGDALARMLEFAGERVTREFYVNDAGTQVRAFGESIRAVARGETPPDGGYQGEYVGELAAGLPDAATRDPADLGLAGVAAMLEQIRASLLAFGVRDFDHWTYESELHRGDPSPVAHTLARLQELGHTYTH
ncbi:MAG: arginyl-tRNA synthetase, partial [Solirubrobacterales bacterium]|nr:arginyl-tRNA synthetase [Solirubrobacterales bacterium]